MQQDTQKPGGAEPVKGLLLNPIFEVPSPGYADVAILTAVDIDTVLAALSEYREGADRGDADKRRWAALQSTMTGYEGRQRAALDKAVLRAIGTLQTNEIIQTVLVCPIMIVADKGQTDEPIPGVLKLNDEHIHSLQQAFRETGELAANMDIRVHPYSVPIEELWVLREQMQKGRFDATTVGMDPNKEGHLTRYDWCGETQNNHVCIRCLVATVSVPRSDKDAIHQMQRMGQGDTGDVCGVLAPTIAAGWIPQIRSRGTPTLTLLGFGIWPEIQPRIEQIAPLFVMGTVLDDLVELREITEPQKLAASVTLQSDVIRTPCTLNDFTDMDNGTKRHVIIRVLLAQADEQEGGTVFANERAALGDDEADTLGAETSAALAAPATMSNDVTLWMHLDFAIGPYRRAYGHLLEDIGTYLRHRGLEHIDVSHTVFPIIQTTQERGLPNLLVTPNTRQVYRLPNQYGAWCTSAEKE